MKQFDVEQGILDCWKVTDDIRLIYDELGNRNMSEDELFNLLLGLESIYKLKFNKLFKHFEELGEEISALRRK